MDRPCTFMLAKLKWIKIMLTLPVTFFKNMFIITSYVCSLISQVLQV